MTAQDQFVLVILLWIMAPFIMVAILIAPFALMTMLEQGRHALQRGASKVLHTYIRRE